MENINSGPADMDEEAQQVNPHLQDPAPPTTVCTCARVSVMVCVCVSQVSLSQLSWSQVETLLERLKVACTGEATRAGYSSPDAVATATRSP